MNLISIEKRKMYDGFYDLWIRILKDGINSLWSIMVYYMGARGVGKSVSAIKDALSLDPDFGIDQICFTKEDINIFIETYAYQGGRIGIWDEFGAEMYSRLWYERRQKSLVRKLEVIRETDLTFLVVMPHIIFADSSIDALATFAIEFYKPKNRNEPYRIGKALKMEGLYSKRTRMEFRPIWLEGRIFHVPFTNPIPKHKELFEAYWKKKRKYVEESIREGEGIEKDQQLTITQIRYLKAFVAGDSISEIANEFDVSETAVKEMKRKLKRKGVLGY